MRRRSVASVTWEAPDPEDLIIFSLWKAAARHRAIVETTRPASIGSGPPPPRAASPARAAIRKWLIDDVFGGPEIQIDGSASLIADMISFAIEKRDMKKLYERNALAVDIDNLLSLIDDQQTRRWDRVTMEAIHVGGPYVGVGWKTSEESDDVLAVAVTGRLYDDESERLAQFFEAMPATLLAIKEALADPL